MLPTPRLWRAGLGALAAVAPMTAPLAQSVTLYGLVDVGVEHVTNVGEGRDGLSRMASNTGSLPSRWGLRGQEDLGGGLAAVFTLESGFAPDSGTLAQGGRLFGRQAWVGLAGGWGQLTLGRQYTMLFWSMLDSDILGSNAYGSSTLDPYIPNARADNAIAYRGSFAGVTLGGHYSLGRDVVNAASPSGTNCPGETAGDGKACRGWSGMVKLDRPAWGAAVGYDRIHGGPGAFGGLEGSDATDSRLSVGGWARFGATKVGAGVLRRRFAADTRLRSDMLYLGASHTVSAWVVDAQVFRLKVDDSPDRATLGAVRVSYLLSKRSTLYAQAARISNDGNSARSVSVGAAGSAPLPGVGQTGVMAGVRHAF